MEDVALGVSGRFSARSERLTPGRRWLTSDSEREAYIGLRLAAAATRPLFVAGTDGLCDFVVSTFGDLDVYGTMAPKVLETLRDADMHSRMLVSTGAIRCAFNFVAWPGTQQEMFAQRYGVYFPRLLALAGVVVEAAPDAVGLLQMDAYVREDVDPHAPDASIDDTFKVDVEFSYFALPAAFQGAQPAAPRTILISQDLCTAADLAQLPVSLG